LHLKRAMPTGSGDAATHSLAHGGDAEAKELFPHASRLIAGRALVQDVWSIFNAVNLPKDTINLGQGALHFYHIFKASRDLSELGYMNFPPPQFVRDAAQEALSTVQGNHYAHPKGHVRVVCPWSMIYERSCLLAASPQSHQELL
jgi:kynurenine aminotransferase